MHDKLKAAIAQITNQPVAYLINTHYHDDHTGGNAAFAKEGAIIVVHQNVKNRLVNPRPDANGQTPPASPPEALPASVFSEKTTIAVAGQSTQVIHIANAHTDGDSFVYFPEANVLAIGDQGGPVRPSRSRTTPPVNASYVRSTRHWRRTLNGSAPEEDHFRRAPFRFGLILISIPLVLI